MTKYFMAVNKARSSASPEDIQKVVPSHGGWLAAEIDGGRVVQAGKWGDAGGMAILKAENLTDAEALIDRDPLFQAGLVDWEVAELFPHVEI